MPDQEPRSDDLVSAGPEENPGSPVIIQLVRGLSDGVIRSVEGMYSVVVRLPSFPEVGVGFGNQRDFYTFWGDGMSYFNHYSNGTDVFYRVMIFLLQQGYYPILDVGTRPTDIRIFQDLLEDGAHGMDDAGEMRLLLWDPTLLDASREQSFEAVMRSGGVRSVRLSIQGEDVVMQANDPDQTTLRIPLRCIAEYLQAIYTSHTPVPYQADYIRQIYTNVGEIGKKLGYRF